MTAQRLIDDYNYYLGHTAQFQARPQRPLKPTPARLAVFNRLSSWCGERGVDPRLFLYGQFRARQWVMAPPLSQLVPGRQSERKALARYEQMREVPLFSKRVVAEIDGSRPAPWDPRVDLSHAVEERKRRYLDSGQSQRCLAEIETRTYGWHGRSVVCARCPVSRQCAAIVRARFGDLRGRD